MFLRSTQRHVTVGALLLTPLLSLISPTQAHSTQTAHSPTLVAPSSEPLAHHSQKATPDRSTASKQHTLTVTATAYTSHVNQTDSTPNIAAWGDTLTPGMHAIAVSRDLLDMGLTRGVVVKIDGIDKSFTVLDKMNKRWKKKIDIYMGMDIEAALEWGKRTVTISWPKSQNSSASAASASISSLLASANEQPHIAQQSGQ